MRQLPTLDVSALASLMFALTIPIGLACAAEPRAAEAPIQAAGDGPCRLLSTADVQRVFTDAKAGTLDRRNEKHGLLTCIWDHSTGRLSIIDDAEPQEPEPVMDEARGWTLIFLDPLKGEAAARHVRYETLAGVGDAAIAIVERSDKAKGFITDAAILVVRRGKRQVSVLSTDLARRERADALKALEDLGKAVAKRLE